MTPAAFALTLLVQVAPALAVPPDLGGGEFALGAGDVPTSVLGLAALLGCSA